MTVAQSYVDESFHEKAIATRGLFRQVGFSTVWRSDKIVLNTE